MFLQQLINGLTIGGTYALVAVGFSMVFGVLELTNLAHNAVYLFGAYLSAALLTNLLPIGVSVPLTILGCGLMGILIDRFALLPMRKRGASRSSYMVCTVGISTFLQNFIQVVFGAEAKPFPAIISAEAIVLNENTSITYIQLFSLIITLVLMTLTYLLITYTKMGAAMRAVAQNTAAARLMGVDVDQVITFTFFLGSALAAVAGILTGAYYRSIDLQLGATVGMKVFCSAVLGGIGVLPGAVLGGVTIGVLETLFAGYVNSGFKDAIGFILVIIVLLIKPTGLMGKKSITKV